MLTLLFGVRRTPQRVLCSFLAVLLTLMGIAMIPLRGALIGIPFALLGLLAVAVMSRQFAAREERVETQKQLDRLSGEYDVAALKQMVDQTPHDPHEQLGRVTGQFSRDEIRAAVEQVRDAEGTDSGSTP